MAKENFPFHEQFDYDEVFDAMLETDSLTDPEELPLVEAQKDYDKIAFGLFVALNQYASAPSTDNDQLLQEKVDKSCEAMSELSRALIEPQEKDLQNCKILAATILQQSHQVRSEVVTGLLNYEALEPISHRQFLHWITDEEKEKGFQIASDYYSVIDDLYASELVSDLAIVKPLLESSHELGDKDQ